MKENRINSEMIFLSIFSTTHNGNLGTSQASLPQTAVMNRFREKIKTNKYYSLIYDVSPVIFSYIE